MPTEGCSLWSDNMVIPVGAPNVGAAFGWMNFIYEPEINAPLAEYITYIPPVEGVQDLVKPELAKDPLVFPSAEIHPQVHRPGLAAGHRTGQRSLAGSDHRVR